MDIDDVMNDINACLVDEDNDLSELVFAMQTAEQGRKKNPANIYLLKKH